MKKFYGKFLRLAGILSLVTVSAIAQNSPDSKVASAAGDIYVVSAKAGGISFVEGKVSVERKNGKSGLLLKGDTLEIGDKVITAADGKAEILLNPGSYLRLGGNSEFSFIETELEKLKLGLTRGSGIFEVYAADDFKVTVQTPKNNYYFIDSGVFRIDLFGEKETLSVWKGLAQVGDSYVNVVKAGRRSLLTGSDFEIVKFDRDESDALDKWSKMRSKELAQINKKLQKDLLRSTLLDTYRNQRWGFYESYGLWVFDPISGIYCFVPFGRGWRSPYGYGLGYNIWEYYPWVYTPPSQPNPPSNPTPPNNPTPPSNEPTQAQIRETRRLNVQTPPFQRLTESNYRNESSGGGGGGGNYDSGNYGSSSSGSSSRDSGNSSSSSSSSRDSGNSSSSSSSKDSSPPPSSNSDSKGKP
ncbi:MAG: FecR domain-containing protein [Pyrinomonadaceae bacterium]|nr:FecR domain-containing protein [Pyrinomonadaceae bacterium]